MPDLNDLASFDSTNGATPVGSLTIDAAGNLYGTTSAGGASGDGTVFELANTPTGYASAPDHAGIVRQYRRRLPL